MTVNENQKAKMLADVNVNYRKQQEALELRRSQQATADTHVSGLVVRTDWGERLRQEERRLLEAFTREIERINALPIDNSR